METTYLFVDGPRQGEKMTCEGELLTLVRSGLDVYALDVPPHEIKTPEGFAYALRHVADPLPEARWSAS